MTIKELVVNKSIFIDEWITCSWNCYKLWVTLYASNNHRRFIDWSNVMCKCRQSCCALHWKLWLFSKYGETIICSWNNLSKTIASVSPGFPNTRKLMKACQAIGRGLLLFLSAWKTPVKHKARVFEMASQSAPNCK